MAKETNNENEYSMEEVLSDIWQKSHRTEALLSVILRNQADIISKLHDIPVEEALKRINDDIADEFSAMEGEEEEEDLRSK